MAMARPTSNARQDLLASVITWVGDHGIGDVSLRTLAEALGTSHRMLLFHFGSKEALWVEVVRAVEADQRAAMAAITTDESATIAEQMRSHWMGMLDPSLRNNIRLFFEVYADALRGRSYTKDFLDEVMSSWLPTVTAALQPVSGSAASVDARLMLAVTRGLLLDLATTGDVESVDAAMQRFTSFFVSATTPIE